MLFVVLIQTGRVVTKPLLAHFQLFEKCERARCDIIALFEASGGMAVAALALHECLVLRRAVLTNLRTSRMEGV